MVTGASNRVHGLDPALRRPGRFDRELMRSKLCRVCQGFTVIIGASDCVQGLDPALLRPGRFDREVVRWSPVGFSVAARDL